jgi:hypothetical protein
MIIVYDLPSEYQKKLSPELKQKIRTSRVKSVKTLHKLGLQCTKSVILVPSTRVNQINQAIEKVAQYYAEIEDLNENPEIEIIEINQVQKAQYLRIAKRYVDRKINEIAEIAQNIAQNATNGISNTRKHQIKELVKEYRNILTLACDLGLATSYVSDFEQVISYLSDMVQ